jgi:hypothetical protein
LVAIFLEADIQPFAKPLAAHLFDTELPLDAAPFNFLQAHLPDDLICPVLQASARPSEQLFAAAPLDMYPVICRSAVVTLSDGTRQLSLTADVAGACSGTVAAQQCHRVQLHPRALADMFAPEDITGLGAPPGALAAATAISLVGNAITSPCMQPLTDLLDSLPQLQELDLSAAWRADRSAFRRDVLPHAAASILQACTVGLHVLRLDSVGLHAAGAAVIAPHLSVLCALERLSLRDNALGARGAVALGPALADLSHLSHLRLGLNRLQAAGMRALVSHIATLPLRLLDLGGNLLREEGAAALATGLHRLTSLTALDVSCNIMSDSGITAVAMHVGRLPSLRHLDFRMNMGVLAIPVSMLMSKCGSVRRIPQKAHSLSKLQQKAVSKPSVERSVPFHRWLRARARIKQGVRRCFGH